MSSDFHSRRASLSVTNIVQGEPLSQALWVLIKNCARHKRIQHDLDTHLRPGPTTTTLCTYLCGLIQRIRSPVFVFNYCHLSDISPSSVHPVASSFDTFNNEPTINASALTFAPTKEITYILSYTFLALSFPSNTPNDIR